jgi:H+/Cl- antiporter ClcA
MTKLDISGFNVIIIAVISVLFILMITKMAEIISENTDDADETKIGTYVMIIYFVSIIAIIIGYVYLDTVKSKNKIQNWMLRWSLNIGGIILLIYTITNYWDYLGDYTKLSFIAFSMFCILYYLYKVY